MKKGIPSPFQMEDNKGKSFADFLKKDLEAILGESLEKTKIIDTFAMKPEWKKLHAELSKKADELEAMTRKIEIERNYLWNLIDQESYKRKKVGSHSKIDPKKMIVNVYE